MRLFYLHVVGAEDSIFSKIRNQIRVFKRFEAEGRIEAFTAVLPSIGTDGENVFHIGDESEVIFKKNDTRLHVLWNLMFSYKKLYKETVKYLKKNDYTHIYIRRATCDRNFISFLQILKKNNIKVLYEIPTYPYDKEFPKGSRMISIDQKYRKELVKYVDKIITPSPGYKRIFNISAECIPNGIDVESVKPVKIRRIDLEAPLNMIAVAGLSEWHAYERLIEGIRIYKENGGKRKVVFHIVGGDENNVYRKKYKDLVDKYHLQENVLFYGNVYGTELDDIYDYCDIGIGSLGVHRLGITVMTTLKSREYLAKGLPMISEGRVDIIPDGFKYMHSVPLSEEPVSIQSIVDFYDDIYREEDTNENIVHEIRSFAQKNCDMYTLMKKITTY